MVALVVFPDTDTLARTILLQELPQHGISELKVGTKVPIAVPGQLPPPQRFIRCFTLPGREISPRTMWCQVIAQVYDETGQDVRCSQTARIVGAILRAAPEIVVDGEQWISEPCEKNGPFPTEDPDLPGRPRYQVNLTWTVQSTVSQ